MNKTVKLLLYCTKAKPDLYYYSEEAFIDNHRKLEYYPFKGFELNGKIVAEAECELVEKIEFKYYSDDYLGEDGKYYQTNTLNQDGLCDLSCLEDGEIDDYLNLKDGYAIRLKNVNPFEKPKELSYYGLKRAPQNMCYADEIIVYPTYVETNFTGYEEYYENRVLISIRPEWLCKILNGEKTIEVRKSILNALKELVK